MGSWKVPCKLAKPPAVPGRSGKLSTDTFLFVSCPSEVRCLLQIMQELSGPTQMTLLIIIILSLSAQSLHYKINSRWKADER